MIPKQEKKPADVAIQPEKALPEWLMMMRRAATDSINEADIREIVRRQVERAKDGDKNAIKFVFDQVLGGAAMKGATFVQNIYRGDDAAGRPDRPTKARPGSDAKVEKMRRRVEADLPPCRDDDNDGDAEGGAC